jgi:hypothetical protein
MERGAIMNEGYNGWTNYETWCVSLWMDNDEGMYNEVRDSVASVGESPRATFEVAQILADYVADLAEATCPGVIEGASFVADMFGHALAHVNWEEIASGLIEEMTE